MRKKEKRCRHEIIIITDEFALSIKRTFFVCPPRKSTHPINLLLHSRCRLLDVYNEALLDVTLHLCRTRTLCVLRVGHLYFFWGILFLENCFPRFTYIQPHKYIPYHWTHMPCSYFMHGLEC